MKIKRSFTRKLNLSNYGGPAYETADFYCEAEEEIVDCIAGETPAQSSERMSLYSNKLHEFCKNEVTNGASLFINQMKKAQHDRVNPK